MNEIIAIVSDSIVVIFDLLIYMKLTSLKRDTIASRIIAYIGSATILIAYFITVFIAKLPPSTSALLCMSLPSFALFWILSKHKDARFFVTFCFVDTVTLIIAFFSRTAGALAGPVVGVIGCAVTFLLLLIIYIKGKPFFKQYREVLESVRGGWNPIMISTLLIYFLLVFSAAYPKPLAERIEYLPVYFVLALSILSFYAVFVSTLLQKKTLYELNLQLQKEMDWHKIAYVDGLTEVKNRMAYIERINELERSSERNTLIHAVIFDIDNFKNINDTFGHHAGDTILKNAADFLNNIFIEDGYELYRIGGDEFAVIAIGVTEDALVEKLTAIKNYNLSSDPGCTFSCGYAAVSLEQNNAMENAFISADMAMYQDKKAKKMK